jgi:hypothetical protein
MNEQIKILDVALEDVDTCNTCITNHVGTHGKDYVRKGCAFLVVLATLLLLL